MGHHHVTSKDLPINGEHLASGKVSGLKGLCLLIGGAGGIGAVLFLIIGSMIADHEKPTSLSWMVGSFTYSYLWAFFFFLTIALGGCFWTLLHNLSNSGWGTSVRRVMENLGFVFPFFIFFALPFFFPSVQDYHFFDFFGSKTTKGLEAGHEALLLNKAWYMNLFSWVFRVVGFSAALIFVINKLRNLSIAQDTDDKPGLERLFQARSMSSWGMAIFGVTITFLAIDFVKGIDFKWFSTMFGVYVFAGSALNSMVIILITTILLRRAGYLKNVVTPEHDHIMGKLMFAFTVFWAYVSFSQFFLYWYANVTEETSYFLLRNTEHWNTVSILLVAGHFFAPFVGLIRQDVKKSNTYMLFAGGYLLFMHALDVYHMIIPERAPSLTVMMHKAPELWVGGLMPVLGDLLAFLVLGAAFLFIFLRNLGSAALYPNRDPRILESANLQN